MSDYTCNLIFDFIIWIIKVWFQNRRMKDKRQRFAVTWPYAAVYTNPSLAASLLQAAANSVGMPYCVPNVMHPPLSMIPSEATHQYPYGYRYMPYQMLHQNAAGMPPSSLAHSHISPLSTSSNETVFTRLDGCLDNDYFESSSSPSNSLSSISDVCFSFICKCTSQMIAYDFNFESFVSFFQMPILQNQIGNSNERNTTIKMTKLDKPKLFQPYKLAV